MTNEAPNKDFEIDTNWRALERAGYGAGLRGDDYGQYLRTANHALTDAIHEEDEKFDEFGEEYFEFLQKHVFQNPKVLQILDAAGIPDGIYSLFERGQVPEEFLREEISDINELIPIFYRAIKIPPEASAEMDHLDLIVEGNEGSVRRRLWYPDIEVRVEDDYIILETDDTNQKTKATLGTFESHIRNMIYGVVRGWKYEMKIHYEHFPMQVNIIDDEVVIENFLGERASRRTEIHGDTSVEVQEEKVVLRGPDKEAVGQTAADIEQITRVDDKDPRVFQDGVYISQKPETKRTLFSPSPPI
jgi:large subunit ribosomal protein L6